MSGIDGYNCDGGIGAETEQYSMKLFNGEYYFSVI